MNSVSEYSNFSMLSQAAYASFGAVTDPIASLTAVKKGDFTLTQAQSFVSSGWTVVDQSSDAKFSDSDFSATLFFNTKTGQYVFANRGTESLTDLLLADGWGITVQGAAGSQILDMYRYYKSLTTSTGLTVTYSSAEIDQLYGLVKYRGFKK